MAEWQPIDLVCAIVLVTLVVVICQAWLATQPCSSGTMDNPRDDREGDAACRAVG